MQEQSWDPKRYATNARFVADLGMPVVELLDPSLGMRILDLGCGDGALTLKLKEFGCDVVGVDASAEQVAAARELGLDARVMDARELQFESEFDAVFTNAALHWVPEADAVVAGVQRALKPGGRFVGEFGGSGNVTAVVAAMTDSLRARGVDTTDVNPWYFPSPEEYTQKLQAQGFEVDSIELIPRPTPIPTDIIGWLDTFGESFSSIVSEAERPVYLKEVQERLRPTLCNGGDEWFVDYVRLRFAAQLRV